jgi:uncharacterized protein (TIGR02217 family)
MPAPTPKPQLYPTPRPSLGLSDAYTDILGGEPLQSNMSGNNTAINEFGYGAALTVVSGGPTGKQVVIPSGLRGGDVTWVRGLYSTQAVPRYDSFMADMTGADITNYAAIPASFTGSISGTDLTVTSMIGPNDDYGYLTKGMTIAGGTVLAGTAILSQSSGTPGGPGVYVVNNSQTAASANLTGAVPAGNSYAGGVLSTVVPVISAPSVPVTVEFRRIVENLATADRVADKFVADCIAHPNGLYIYKAVHYDYNHPTAPNTAVIQKINVADGLHDANSLYVPRPELGFASPPIPSTDLQYSSTPYADAQMAIDATGGYLYLASGTAGSGTAGAVFQFQIGSSGALTPLSPASVSLPAITVARQFYKVFAHPTQPYIYVLLFGGATLYVFHIGTGGALSLSTTVTIPKVRGWSMAIAPSGAYAYVTCSDPTITYDGVTAKATLYLAAYSLSGASMTPLSPATVAVESVTEGSSTLLGSYNYGGVTADSTGAYLYVGTTALVVHQYAIGSGGALTPLSPAVLSFPYKHGGSIGMMKCGADGDVFSCGWTSLDSSGVTYLQLQRYIVGAGGQLSIRTTFGDNVFGGPPTVAGLHMAICGSYSYLAKELTVLSMQVTTALPQLQAYYSYRNGTRSVKGQAMAGYPMLHADQYQGTADDGDNYMMAALMHAHLTTRDQKYRDLALRIGGALVDAGAWNSNKLKFDVPFAASEGQVGFYSYSAPTTPLSIDNVPLGLQIQTLVNSGGPPYNYAGFGFWPTVPVTAYSTFRSLDITMIGDGSGRGLLVNLNTDPAKGTVGDYYARITMLPQASYAQTLYSLKPSDFAKVGNIVYDSGHQDFSYIDCYGSDANALSLFTDVVNNKNIQQFTYDFSGNSSGYAGMYFGPAASSSAGTSALNISIYANAPGVATLTATDNAAVDHKVFLLLKAGWHDYVIPWIGSIPAGTVPIPPYNDPYNPAAYPQWAGIFFGPNVVGFSQSTFTHPVTQIAFDVVGVLAIPNDLSNTWNALYYAGLPVLPVAPGTSRLSGGVWYPRFPVANTVAFDHVSYDAIITMASITPTVLNGVQISFPSNSSGKPYNVSFQSIEFKMDTLDGPTSDPLRYAGLPRWTDKWLMVNGYIGYGAWRGPSAVGYLWMSGWQQSGIVNPANGRLMSDQMLTFMADSQAAYTAQFPAQLQGPFAPRYGRPSWEAINTKGYVGGTLQASTYNQWYWPDTDDWYGYTYRALLSVAQHYYYSRSPTAKAILDKWMTWLDAKIIADGAYWWPPSIFYNDGTVGYTYHPVYAYALIAAACIYKYWVDGDTIASKWYRRLLDDIFARQRQTVTGQLAGIYPAAEGSGYTTASVVFTCNGTAPTATCVISGGKVTSYRIVTPGSGMTFCTAAITGDGSGAVGNAYLSDDLVGAFSTSHTGWEAAEVFNTYAMLINGARAGGTVSYPIGSVNDVSTASYSARSASVATQAPSPTGLSFRSDGTAFYATGAGTIYQYGLTAAWDVQTASYSTKSLNVSAQDSAPYGTAFSTDGTKLYVSGRTTDKVYQYALSVAWDISTGTYSGKSLNISGQDPKPYGLAFKPDGLTVYVAGYSNDRVYQYTLTTAWDISTASYASKTVDTAADTDTPGSLAFSPDGTLMTISGAFSHTAMVYQYTLATPWDCSTATFNSRSFSAATQDSSISAALLSADGTKVYVIGKVTGKVYQYGLQPYTANDLAAFTGLIAFYQRTARDTRPSMMTSDWVPLHEYRVDPYHEGSAIENPMVKDTHAKGAMWTETIGPTITMAVEYGRYSGDWSWLDTLYALSVELTGNIRTTAMAVFPSLPGITWGSSKAPSFNTQSFRAASGFEVRAALMQYPLWTFTLSYELLRDNVANNELKTMVGFFNARKGAFEAFLYTDPSDNTVTLGNFGTGNGSTLGFQLSRSLGGFSEPVQNLNTTPSIYVNGVLKTLTTDYSISSTGLVTFVTAPAAGAALTWSGTFYYRVRFVNDTAEFSQFLYNLFELKKLSFVGSTMNKV